METIKVQKNQINCKTKRKSKSMVFNFRRFGRTEKFLCEDCSEQRKCDRCLGKRPVFVRLYCERRFCACSFSIQYSR